MITQLKEGWSPEQIAGRSQYDDQSIRASHETIYTNVYGSDGQSTNWPVICRVDARNGNRDADAHRVALFFRRIVRFMSDLPCEDARDVWRVGR